MKGESRRQSEIPFLKKLTIWNALSEDNAHAYRPILLILSCDWWTAKWNVQIWCVYGRQPCFITKYRLISDACLRLKRKRESIIYDASAFHFHLRFGQICSRQKTPYEYKFVVIHVCCRRHWNYNVSVSIFKNESQMFILTSQAACRLKIIGLLVVLFTKKYPMLLTKNWELGYSDYYGNRDGIEIAK